MDAHREFEAKDLEEALRLAGEALGVPSESLAYTLIDGGRRGVFGLGARSVRIRVSLEDAELARPQAPTLPPPPVAAVPDEPKVPEPPAAPARKSEEPRAPRRGDERRPRPAPPRPPAARPPEPVAPAPRAAADPAVLTTMGEVAGRMLALMGLDMSVDVQPVEDGCVVRMQGDDRTILVENDGEVLGAFEFLLNRMARRSWPDAGSIRVQCDGFRNSRDREIVERTRELAFKVARTGLPEVLHPMNPYERRLVHMTAREIPGIASHSEGEGFLKRITLAPTRDAE